MGTPPSAFPSEDDAKRALLELGIDADVSIRRWMLELVGRRADDVLAHGLEQARMEVRRQGLEGSHQAAAERAAELKRRGWSAQEIALELDVSYSTVLRWLQQQQQWP